MDRSHLVPTNGRTYSQSHHVRSQATSQAPRAMPSRSNHTRVLSLRAQDSNYSLRCGLAGNRLVSCFVCLAQADSGGETCFPRLGQSHRLRPGDALIWMNIESHRGWLDRRTLHAGRPVAGAEPKWGLNIWLRQRPFRPSAEDSAMEGGGSAGGSAAAVVGQDPRSSAPAGTPAIPAVGGAVVRGMASAPAAGGPAGVEPWKPGWTPPRQTAASALAQVSLERRERE